MSTNAEDHKSSFFYGYGVQEPVKFMEILYECEDLHASHCNKNPTIGLVSSICHSLTNDVIFFMLVDFEEKEMKQAGFMEMKDGFTHIHHNCIDLDTIYLFASHRAHDILKVYYIPEIKPIVYGEEMLTFQNGKPKSPYNFF
jgi:hypothetical protein